MTNPGAGQTVQTINLVDAGNGVHGLDDAEFAGNGAKTLLVADTANNTIDAVTGNFTPGALYASIGSTHSLDLVIRAPALTTQITGLFPANASPHGLAFLPAAAAVPEPRPFALLGLGLLALPFCARRRSGRSKSPSHRQPPASQLTGTRAFLLPPLWYFSKTYRFHP